MKIDFIEKDNWILPIKGNLGNKAKNLLENSQIIKECDFKIPRSLVIPYEYLQTSKNPEEFTLRQIDKYFPDWKKILVRSNAPDEDLNFRVPGLYISEYIYYKDREYALVLINDVIESYNNHKPKLIRKQLGLEERAMCILAQENISNTEEIFDVNYSGFFV